MFDIGNTCTNCNW